MGRRILIRDMKTSLSVAGGAATDNVTVPSSTSLQLGGAYTFSAFVFPNSLGANTSGRIFDKANEYNFLVQANNVLRVGNGAAAANSSNNVFNLGVWQHVAATYDGTNANFYVNGTTVGSTALSTNPSINTNNLTVGNSGGLNRAWDGFMDEVAIWKGQVLTPTQIADIYFQNTYLATNLSALWKFDEGSGTVAIDSSGNGNTGGITTATYSTTVFSKPRVLYP